MKECSQGRIGYYDVAKGIGILLVVWGHANAPGTEYINQFHMPFFIIISGLLYSENRDIKDFCKAKVYNLYFPFVFWNLLYYFLIDLPLCGNIRIEEILLKPIAICLTLTKSAYFGGATWFLGSLFLITCFYRITSSLLETYIGKNKYFILFLVSCALAIIGFIVELPFYFSRTLILNMFFSCVVLAKNNIHINLRWVYALAALAISSILMTINAVSMGNNYYKYPIAFIITAFLMAYFLLWLSRVIDTRIWYCAHVLSSIGRNSLDILLWHFVAFRVVIILQLIYYGKFESVVQSMNYYPIYSSNNYGWAFYVIAGVLMPLIFGALIRKTKIGKRLRRIHII